MPESARHFFRELAQLTDLSFNFVQLFTKDFTQQLKTFKSHEE